MGSHYFEDVQRCLEAGLSPILAELSCYRPFANDGRVFEGDPPNGDNCNGRLAVV